jgi:hypothetical protein
VGTRILTALYWTVGLVGFGRAIRLVGVWWLLVMPLIGIVVASLVVRPPSAAPIRLRFRALLHATVAGVLAVSAVNAYNAAEEVSLGSRNLPTLGAGAVRPIADWIVNHTPPTASGRIFTTFNYGSYLTWRLPRYSSSLDSRGSFPVSLVAPYLLRPGLEVGDVPLGPWREADLAVVPVNSRFAAALDSARGWRRVVVAEATRPWPDTAGLWIRDPWWARTVGGEIPPPDLLRAPTPRAPR